MANFETIEEKYLDFLENHAEHNSLCCDIGKTIINCDCLLADFIRTAYVLK
jgi:hypothetical protein